MVALKKAHAKPAQEPVEPEVTTTGSLPVVDQRGAWLFAAAWEIHQRRHRTNSASPLSKTSLVCALLLLEDDIRKAAESAGLRTTDFFSVVGLLDESLPDHLPTPPPDLQLTDRLTAILTNYRSHLPTGSALDRLALAHLLLSDPGGPLPDRLLRAGAERLKVNDVLEQTLRQGLLDRLVSILRFRRDQLTKAVGGDNAYEGPSPIGRFVALGSKVTATDHLNRQGLVEALAAMLEDPQQETPLTIALLGDWGSGKSTLMALLRKRLDEGRPRRFCFADFNAWEYELTENMAAGLAQEVVAGITRDTRLVKWLPRILSPGFWWLFAGFCLRTHGSRLIALALLAAAGVWLALRHQDLLTAAGLQMVPQQVLDIAGFAGALIVLFYLFRGAKHVIEHPFAVELKTYLRMPRYEHYLGLVPVLKRDVTTFARLWLGRTRVQFLVAAWLDRGARRYRWPRLERWSRPRRLVVFVDDLDRCSHDRIGQTLDGIRLVMDVPETVVVLGIDPRIAFKAMALQYEKLADPSHGAAEIARDYLGKIIQIPIRLRRPSGEDLEEFVKARLFAKQEAEPVAEHHSQDMDHVVALGSGRDATPPGPAVPPDAAKAPAPGASAVSDEAVTTAAGTVTATRGGRGPSDRLDPTRWRASSESLVRFHVLPDTSDFPTLPSIRLQLEGVMRHNDEDRREFQRLVREFDLHNPRQLIRLFNSFALLKLFASIRTDGLPAPPAAELLGALFLEEYLHGLPQSERDAAEEFLAIGGAQERLTKERLAALRRIAAAVSGPAEADAPSTEGMVRPSPIHRNPRLRDFVDLVVLPAVAATNSNQGGETSGDSKSP